MPKGSERFVQWLRDNNGPGLYERKVLRGYAHLDGLIGRNAHKDVFPHILDHLDRYQTVG
jgi:cholesterol oxidase